MGMVDPIIWNLHGPVAPMQFRDVLREIARRRRARDAWLWDWTPPASVGTRSFVDALTESCSGEYTARASTRARNAADRLSEYAARTSKLARYSIAYDDQYVAKANSELGDFVRTARTVVLNLDQYLGGTLDGNTQSGAYAQLYATSWWYVDRAIDHAARSTAHLLMLNRIRRSRDEWQTWAGECSDDTGAGLEDDEPFLSSADLPERDAALPSAPELCTAGHETRAGPRSSNSASDPDCRSRLAPRPWGEAVDAPQTAPVEPVCSAYRDRP
jgi:hypothetical protein